MSIKTTDSVLAATDQKEMEWRIVIVFNPPYIKNYDISIIKSSTNDGNNDTDLLQTLTEMISLCTTPCRVADIWLHMSAMASKNHR